MNRIDEKFKDLKEKNKKALITFITAGDPSLEKTKELVLTMEKEGADIIELGIPYSDPIADGPVIQASSQRSLNNGTKIKDIMKTVKDIRLDSQVPLLYLVYYNSVFKYGIEKFIIECNECGIDGLIIPDLPLEERSEISSIAKANNVALIPMVTPTSKDRIENIVKHGQGFVYCVSVNGVTGVRNEINTNLNDYMNTVGNLSPIPKALGFGISNSKMVKEYKKYCDGIIIGSAIIKKVSENLEAPNKAVGEFVRELSKAL
jgi:tryptophan synthase alpha chain